MNMTRTAARLILTCSFSIGAGTALAEPLNGARGGALYDNWWRAAGLPEPTGNHPLYPPTAAQSGSATWRCVECHGWDYRGSSGVYATGPHATGIRGVLGSALSREQMFDVIKVGHGYQAAGLSDEHIRDLVEFVKVYAVDTGPYIDSGGVFVGSESEGRLRYRTANGFHNCLRCHGEAPAALSDLATQDPWQLLHKVRCGDAGTVMPSWILVPGQTNATAADIGRFIQAGFPAPEYAGDQACMACHADSPSAGFFDGYRRSAHPWQLYRTGGQTPGAATWPWTPVPPLPSVNGGATAWSGVEYVVGNFSRRARLVDRAGYFVTGGAADRTQWNIDSQTWSAFFAGIAGKSFELGATHTTGFNAAGHQGGLAGVSGTWAQDGVRCEACHGPSADHVAHPGVLNPPGGKDCASCHAQDPQNRMAWRDGFFGDLQESEQLRHSAHEGAMTCVSCHDPHKSTSYNEGGVRATCSSCHPGTTANRGYVVAGMESVACVDCHMPRMGKIATANSASQGDLRGHIMRMTTAPITAAQNVYTAGAGMFWNQDARGRSVTTLDYACLGCHTEIGRPLSMLQAADFAKGIHTRARTCAPDFNGDGELNPDDLGDYITCYFEQPACSRADFNGDGDLNPDDLGDFITAYFMGCSR